MLEFLPVSPERGGDLERFSSRHGKFRYCSCMRWRMTSAEFKASDKEARVAALAALAEDGEPVGVLAYDDGEPVGWCAVAPREGFRGLERYRALARVDETPVWSVVCLFVDASARRQGLTTGLLRAAARYAVAAGAGVVEGYPVEPDARLYTYMGSPAAFAAAGFHDVTPPGRERRVFRYVP
ncbi:GNAT family N-acetyltransferase [Streptacidiphilus rugosus]|uniref:GNAT family N-acetyltransferase n=1 Tax=Streptacidiphilus rugosus TaxID=405783 RepID=UPI00055CF060|nr:GNAT family N-acetyltransferase [Streptacidiphilus rugosus]